MENNEKKLIKIIVIGIIIIFIIIIIYLINNVFTLSKYNYDMPTTLKVDNEDFNSAKNIEKKERKRLNDILYQKDLITAINNVIDGTYANKNIDYFSDEKNLFIYAYTKLTVNNDIPDFNNINSMLLNDFNKEISEEFIKDYEKDGMIVYNIKYPAPAYCLKANKIISDDLEDKLYVDVLDYDNNDCDPSIIDYDESKVLAVGVINIVKNGDKRYANSFILID